MNPSFFVPVWMLLGGAPAMLVAAPGEVLIHNHTGAELTVLRPSGSSDTALLIRLARAESGEQRLAAGRCHRADPSAGPTAFTFPAGASAWFRFEDGSRDQTASLVFWHREEAAGVVFRGSLNLTLTVPNRPDVGARAAVSATQSPTGQALGQNRWLLFHSNSEVELR